GGRGSHCDFLSSCPPAPGRQRGFQQYVPLCCPAYWGEHARFASQPGRPGVDPGTARCGPPIEAVPRDGGRCWIRGGIGKSGGPPAPGNCLVAVPKSRQVQLLVGRPVGHSSLQLPEVVSTLPWA